MLEQWVNRWVSHVIPLSRNSVPKWCSHAAELSVASYYHLASSGNSQVAAQWSQKPPQVQIPQDPWIPRMKTSKHQTLLCSLQDAKGPSSSRCQVDTKWDSQPRQGSEHLTSRTHLDMFWVALRQRAAKCSLLIRVLEYDVGRGFCFRAIILGVFPLYLNANVIV